MHSWKYLENELNGFLIPKKRLKKYINQVTHPLSSADISIFSPKLTSFRYIEIYR